MEEGGDLWAAGGGSDQGDGPSERGGHFGSEPAGAKLFDPAILDFGAAAAAAGIGRGMDWAADGLRCRRRGARVREFHDRFQGAMYHKTSTHRGSNFADDQN